MEKESDVAMRRLSRIADHVAGSYDDVTHPNHQLFPVNCSSALKSRTPRRDSRMFFARQGSASQARFMRQISVSHVNTVSRPSDHPLQNSPINGDSSCKSFNGAMFARPTKVPCNQTSAKLHRPLAQINVESSAVPPNFARPLCGETKKNQLLYKTEVDRSSTSGARMDVAETASYHVLTLEIPGANIVDIKVEVDDKNLTVTGERSYPKWRAEAPLEEKIMTYHKRQISQGPYVVVWPIPTDVDRDSISAELLNGFLRITLPKVSDRRIPARK